MPTYTLKFTGDGACVKDVLSFEAEDVATALIIAHRHAAQSSAELWDHVRRLCTIRRARQNQPRLLIA